MRFGSVCSGIEAASVAWSSLVWSPQYFAEIEQFPCAVLAHHYPDIPNLGDMTKIHETEIFRNKPIDLLVGGTPCQSFSVAGLRKGLADPRGNLALHFLKLAGQSRARWVVWENVPGVLSSNGGRDFASFLGALAKLGYGWAYRVLDAQHFGVPQRRRRVFVVGHLGDWRVAAAVLFERASLSGHPAPSRAAGQRIAACLTRGAESSGRGGYAGRRREDDENCVAVAPSLTGSGHGVERIGESRGQDPVIAHALTCHNVKGGDPTTDNYLPIGVSFSADLGHCLRSGASRADNPESTTYINHMSAVRRLTPRECERLQGFPDDYTLVPFRGKLAADSPRYKALGNSMAVPIMRWIGERITVVDEILKKE